MLARLDPDLTINDSGIDELLRTRLQASFNELTSGQSERLVVGTVQITWHVILSKSLSACLVSIR
jgi:hypothetical protein